MLSIDWRSPAAYEHAKSIPAAGFAWEYLRRDNEYHRDFQNITRIRKPAVRTLDAFSRRWGLRFPMRSRNTARPTIAVLDSKPSTASRVVVAHTAQRRARGFPIYAGAPRRPRSSTS